VVISATQLHTTKIKESYNTESILVICLFAASLRPPATNPMRSHLFLTTSAPRKSRFILKSRRQGAIMFFPDYFSARLPGNSMVSTESSMEFHKDGLATNPRAHGGASFTGKNNIPPAPAAQTAPEDVVNRSATHNVSHHRPPAHHIQLITTYYHVSRKQHHTPQRRGSTPSRQ